MLQPHLIRLLWFLVALPLFCARPLQADARRAVRSISTDGTIQQIVTVRDGNDRAVPEGVVYSYERQEGAPKRLKLSILEADEHALRANKTLAVNRLNPQIALSQLLTQKGTFDESITYASEHLRQVQPTASALAGARVAKSDTRLNNLGFRKRLLDGTTIQTTFNNQRNETNSTFQSLNPNHQSQLQTAILKPLLQGGGISANTALIRIARNNVSISYYQLANLALASLQSVERSYWDLVFSIEDLKVRQLNLQKAQELVRYNRTRMDAGLGSEVQLVQAQTTEATRMQDVELAQRFVYESQEALRQMLSLEYIHAGIEIVPTDRATRIPAAVPLNHALACAFHNRPDYLAAYLDLKNKKINVFYLKNLTLPRIDLVATYGQNGLANTVANTLDQVASGDFYNYDIGVRMDVPLTNRTARGNFRQGTLQAHQSVLNLKVIEDQIVRDVTTAVRSLDVDRQRVATNKRAVGLAEKQLQQAESQYQQGLISNIDLIVFQTQLATARSNLVAAQRDALKDEVNVLATSGGLLDERHIEIEKLADEPLVMMEPLKPEDLPDDEAEPDGRQAAVRRKR